jgi:hypothetical protein
MNVNDSVTKVNERNMFYISYHIYITLSHSSNDF